ncbi:MAG TPA: hypothetical protein PLO65_09005 [Caulobacter sp.]|nr:hypothetical protein [Caulobacter sp.]
MIDISEPAQRGAFDLYGPIHKGLRMAHANLLIRLGAAELEDRRALGGLLAHLRDHLDLCAEHLRHEQTVIHTALAPFAPGAVAEIEVLHRAHLAGLPDLHGRIDALETAAPAGLRKAGRALYLAFSRFVASDLTQMAHEEEVLLPLLQAAFDDAELIALKTRIVLSMTPDVGAGMLRMIIPAARHRERLSLLRAVGAAAQQDIFEALLREVVRPSLADREWRRLADELLSDVLVEAA